MISAPSLPATCSRLTAATFLTAFVSTGFNSVIVVERKPVTPSLGIPFAHFLSPSGSA